MKLSACLLAAVAALASAHVSAAAEIAGTAGDPSGAPLETAQITLHNLATGAELTAEADGAGRFRFDDLPVGIYRVVVVREGFSDDARTVAIADEAERLELAFVLRPGGLTASVTVTATRSERELRH